MVKSSESSSPDVQKLDVASVEHSLINHLIYSVGKDTITATDRDWFYAIAYAVRERLIGRWMETMRSYYEQDAKRVYYLSMEFLIGRTMLNSLLNCGFEEECRQAVQDLGEDLERIRQIEPDAALGNGGLGRLAACFLDSMATLGLPGYGYGIRYEYGMFNQRIENGYQVEHPDNWLRYGNPWEFARPEVLFPVKFHGRVVEYADEKGQLRHHWVETEDVMAMAYDTPIPGYGTKTVNNMRLWAAKASRDFDLQYFNEGNYIKAVEDKNQSENLSKVLYPNDTTQMGRELRLKQQYFFVSASIQDILYRFDKSKHPIEGLPEKVAIQLNDTHPSIAIPELMRVLVDLRGLDWDRAWNITTRVFSYTNHTLMPEALETWPVALLENVLPRHLQIIYEINRRFLAEVVHRNPGDVELMRRMSLVDEDRGRRVRMAYLAIVGSHHVNGVAQIHTDLMKSTIFSDFARFYPSKIINITNGITPRRWLNQANPGRRHRLISAHIGKEWITDLSQLEKLAKLAGNTAFREQFRAIKHANKVKLSGLIHCKLGISVNPMSLFDVQIKRIHEYKRQLLNVLHVVTRYNRIRANPDGDFLPRTVSFRRQGGTRLSPCQTDHQADQRHRRRGQQRPGGARFAESRVPPQLRRHFGIRHRARRRPFGTDFHRRHRSLRHRQHEAGNERRAHHRHTGRRQHRNPRSRRRRQHLHIRSQRGGGQRPLPQLQPVGLLPRQRGTEAGFGHDRRRLLLARRPRALSPDLRHVDRRRRSLLVAGRLRQLHGLSGEGRRALPRHPAVGGEGHTQRGRHGILFQRPHHRRICRENLECPGGYGG